MSSNKHRATQSLPPPCLPPLFAHSVSLEMSNQLSASPQPPVGSPGAGGQSPVSRPSGISTRPHQINQGRLRSRSINNNAAQPQVANGVGREGGKGADEGYLAPTLMGSPEVGNPADFGEQVHGPSSNQQSTSTSAPSITLSTFDSRPNTPRSGTMGLSSSAPQSSAHQPAGPYANSGPQPQPRRGRSFTSLLVQPATPTGGVTPFENVEEETDDYFEKDYTQRSSSPDDIEAGFSPTLEQRSPSPSVPLLAVNGSPAPPLPPVRRRRLTEFLPHLAILLFLFLGSFGVILALVASLSALFIPHSFSQLPALVSALVEYRASSWLAEMHLFAVLSALFVWKQAFSIPGSILTNAIFGALYGTGIGTAWACLWTAVGSTGAYGIARVIAPLVEYYFATPLAMTRRTLKLQAPADAVPGEEPAPALSSGDLFSYLLLARFFPLLPYSVMNVISGVLQLPLPTFFVTLVLGSFPFNFVTVSVGSVVAVAAGDPDTPLGDKIWTGEMLAKLMGVTVVSVAPMVFKKQIQRVLGNPRLAANVAALPGRAVWGVSRAGESVVRQVGFILGAATPETQAAPVGAYQSLASHLGQAGRASGEGLGLGRASHETAESEGGRTWRHKWNPSWGGDGYKAPGGELLGRWEEDEPDRRDGPVRGQTM